jgi:hypothetical protein
MEFEASGLLSMYDEEDWDHEGLFKTMDELCGLSVGQRHLGNTLNHLEQSPPTLSSPFSPGKAPCDSKVLINQSSRPPSTGDLPVTPNNARASDFLVIGIKGGSGLNRVDFRTAKDPSTTRFQCGAESQKVSRTRKATRV